MCLSPPTSWQLGPRPNLPRTSALQWRIIITKRAPTSLARNLGHRWELNKDSSSRGFEDTPNMKRCWLLKVRGDPSRQRECRCRRFPVAAHLTARKDYRGLLRRVFMGGVSLGAAPLTLPLTIGTFQHLSSLSNGWGGRRYITEIYWSQYIKGVSEAKKGGWFIHNMWVL